MMQRLQRIAINPVTYMVWVASLAAGLFAAHSIDPYVFGFATLIAAWLSVVPVVAGLAVVILGRTASAAARALIALSVAGIVTIVGIAFMTLGRINWA